MPAAGYRAGIFTYTVHCRFDDPAVAARWVEWLEREHLDDVLAAGAASADVVRLDGEPVRCEVRYRFASRQAFEAYEREHAPRLREEGLRRFPLELGLHYTRTTGPVVSGRSQATGSPSGADHDHGTG